MLVRLVFGVALAFCFAAKGNSGTSIEVLSPTNGATFAEGASPAFKVRIANSDGTLRLYEGPPNTNSPGSMADLLLFTNVPTTGVVDLPLTNLAPGTYTFGLTVREPIAEWRLMPAMVTFTVTNRVRAVPKYMMIPMPGPDVVTPLRINSRWTCRREGVFV